MRVCPVTFGNRPLPPNHEEMQNRALAEILKHWQETGDFRPAQIDYYEGQSPKITYIGEIEKTSVKTKTSKSVFSKIKKFFKGILKK